MDLAQHVKSQLDIVRVISDYVPRLRRFGNRYSCLCPFHNEKTPSFSIYADHQFYKCFGCDAKGDVFSFVMNIERLTFWEALKKLAEQNGIELPKQSAATDDRTKTRAILREMHEIALDHFRANLAGANGAQTRAYINQRGVTGPSAQLFQLGLADSSGRSLLRILEQRHFKPDGGVGPHWAARRRHALRSFPQPAHVPHSRRIGQGDRIRGPRARSRR
jgi:DNA primase